MSLADNIDAMEQCRLMLIEDALQHTAAHCNPLQRSAAHSTTLQRIELFCGQS